MKILGAVLMTLLATLGATAAQARPGGSWPGGSSQYVTVQVNQYFQGQAVLDLSLYLGAQLGGREVTEVQVEAASQASRGQVTLLDRGQTVDGPRTLGTQLQTVRLVPRFTSGPWGQQQDLALALRGRIFVKSISATVDFQTQPHGGIYIEKPVRQRFSGRNYLDISRYIDLTRYYGRSISSVTIRASSAWGHGKVTLVTNGWSGGAQTQSVGTMMDETSFRLGGVLIGQDIRSLGLQLDGQLDVDAVAIELGR